MAFQAITTNQSSTYQIQDDDYFVLMPGIYVQSGGQGFYANAGGDVILQDTSLTVLGTIAAGGLGIDMTSHPTSVIRTSVVIGETGAVHAADGGVVLDYGGGNTIINHGEVTSGGYVLALGGFGADNRVENYGRLTLIGTDGAAAIWIGGGSARAFVVNGGLITGMPAGGGPLVDIESPASFVNSGQILGQGGLAVGLSELADTLTNSGVIEGSIELRDGADRMFNTGTVLGEVDLGEGDDLYRVLGEAGSTGIITGGAGDDTLVGGALDDQLSGGSNVDLLRGQGGNDDLSGGGGTDTILAGEGNDTVSAGTGADSVRGGHGDDMVSAGDGADSVRSGSGDDTVSAGNGADTVRGGNGDDSLQGGNGADNLYGGPGNDTLLGGADNDRLFGGAGVNELDGQGGRDVIYAQSGEDTIIFQSASHSPTGSNRDVIREFDLGQDLIDLSKVAPGLLTFIGGSSFSGTANELRIVEMSSGSTMVQVDVDGDGDRDMEILVAFRHGLSEMDFLL